MSVWGRRGVKSSETDGAGRREGREENIGERTRGRPSHRRQDTGLLPLPVTAGEKEIRSTKRLARKRSRAERKEERETVAGLIDSMRNGKERGRATDATSRSQATADGGGKSARIQGNGNGLRVRWARFKQRLGTGSALSESLMDGTGESTNSSRSWRRGYRGGGGGPATTDGEEEEGQEVDEVVVDNDLGSLSYTQPSESGTPPTSNSKNGAGTGTGDTTSKSGVESLGLYAFFRWRLLPLVYHFFDTRFLNEGMEAGYRKETWCTSKSLALYSSLFFIVNWILIIGFGFRPFTLSDKIIYYGIGPIVTFPLPFAVIYDWPRERPWMYHIWVGAGVWIWPFYNTAFMAACHFYPAKVNPVPSTCGARDFLSFFYYAIGLQVMAMFGLRMARIVDVAGVLILFIVNCALILPNRPQFTRNLINMLIFHGFLLYVHYKREATERRLYSLRDQLKVQFRATQKAQVNERKASDSKRRLTSYVFHEVRVPLNTALLAVQNLEATGTVRKAQEIEWAALGGSLSMMSKVLNDVLDFDRLDSGRFSTVKMPYNFHQTIKSILVPLGLAASQRGLSLKVDLDKNIDLVARRASYYALKKSDAWIEQELSEHPDEEGFVVGDEMRLRQIVNNLASNACKFTLSGGEIRIVTRLVYPESLSGHDGEREEVTSGEKVEERRDDLEKGSEKNEAAGEKEREKAGEGNSSADVIEKEDEEHKNGGSDSVKEHDFAFTKWAAQRRRKSHANTNSKPSDRKHNPEKFTSTDGTQVKPADVNLPSMPLSTAQLSRHNSVDEMHNLENIVVRVEIHDTGFGIRAKDLVDNKLFSPYVQTEIGKYQGGKGTGLGLALVRRIVKLSGGRLGVKSKLGEGSTFWVEIPLGVGEKAVSDTSSRPDIHHDGSEYSEGQRQRALGLEEIKFFRAIGEGDTPSTVVDEAECTPIAMGGEGTVALPLESNLAAHLPTPPETAATLPTLSGRALRGIMDQRGPFELPTQPKPRVKRASALMEMRNDSQALMSLTPASGAPIRDEGSECKGEDTPRPTHPGQMSIERMRTSETESTAAESMKWLEANGDTVEDHAQEPSITTATSATLLQPAPSLIGPSVSAPTPLETSPPQNSQPLRPDNDPPPPPAPPQIDPNIRVLVVDDDALTRRLMQRMLSRLGCSVDTAENGKIALEKVLNGPIPPGVLSLERGMPPDLYSLNPESDGKEVSHVYVYDVIFLDNQMPVMSGIDTVSVLRTLGRRDLVVGVTGNALLSDQQEYLDVGVDRVLTKPVFESSLKSMLIHASQRRRDINTSVRPSEPQRLPYDLHTHAPAGG